MKSLYAALTALFFLFTNTAIADDVLIPFGQNSGPVAASSWKYLGGGTSLDASSPSWKSATFSDAGWINGYSALGFFGAGTIPPRSTLIPLNGTAGSGGTAPGAPYPTMYFRKTINIANPAAYAAFKISTQFDDAIIIWVNGVEAYRNNIAVDPTYITLSDGSNTGYNNGATVYNATVSSGLFTAGNNIIAVEVHQNSATSSDLFFDMELTGLTVLTGTLTRGPYLQVGNQTGVTIRWRTDIATDSRVTWGTAFGTYPNTVDDAALTTEHIVRVNGLSADTKYFYTIGSTTQTLQATNTNYVLTAPPANGTRKLRFSAIGDCGNASTNQVDTKNALLNYIGTNDIDGTILLGDNAYSSGTDGEYQAEFFDIYKNDLLRNKKLYPAPGNHDYGNSNSNTAVRNNAYYNNFSLPTAAECGGVASGTEAYYSFDIGDVHFLSLDSYGRENTNTTKLYDTAGAQALWVKNDLATNTKKWVVVYFHHPPYTKTSHDSDTELGDLGAMRENFIRILERYGVDLVLCGHSHGYERSYLLKNYYKANPGDPTLLEPAFNIATHTALGNTQNAKYDGTANSCAYTYSSGQYNHGSMYVVAGSAGQIGGASAGYPHNAMYYSNNTQGGSLYFEVDSNRLDAKFISYSGTGAGVTPVIRDQFTIFKDVNRVYNLTVNQNTALDLSASWRGNYVWPDNGNATAQSITLTNTVAGNFTYRVKDAAAANCLQDIFNVTVNGTLPVSLLSFEAKLNNDKVLLNWSTAQEQDNKHFTIEKSTNGTAFNFFSKMDGAVNSSTAKDYYVTDFTPALGDNYYRLSQINTNNKITYLQTRKVTYKGNQKFSVSIVYPANENTSMIINSSRNDKVSMRVIDMLGKEIMQEIFIINAGANSKVLPLQKGIYVLALTNSNGDTINSKIIIQ
jgi:predicted MPP superfamily phosphohydrolase